MGNKSVAPAYPETYYTHYPTIYSYTNTSMSPPPSVLPTDTATETPCPEPPVPAMNTTVTRTSVVESHSGVETRTTNFSTTSTHTNQSNAPVVTNLEIFPSTSNSATHFVSAIRPTPVYVPEPGPQSGQSSVVVVNSQVTHVRSQSSVIAALANTPITSSANPKVTVYLLKSEQANEPPVSDSLAYSDSTAIENISTPTPSVDKIMKKPANSSPSLSPDISVTSPTVDFPRIPSPTPAAPEISASPQRINSSKMIQFPRPPASPAKLTAVRAKTPSASSSVLIKSPTPSPGA